MNMHPLLVSGTKSLIRSAAWLLAFSLPITCIAFGQMDQGTIIGVVQDNTGAVIPNAEVALTNIDTELQLHTTTDSKGVFVFSPVKIGNYTLSASSPGFQRTEQTHIHLDVQQRLNVLLTMKPGSLNQTVFVTTAPPLLQTADSSVGQVVSASSINNTPLNGRNWTYIAQLTPGVVAAVGNNFAPGTGGFSANGQRSDQNDYLLDGVDNNITDYQNGASFDVLPPPDALAEFKLQTSNYSAEFGHSVGAVLNASIKSGTNDVHGDAWEYVRNTSLDSRDWNAQTIPPYHENQFGATLGFPIIRNRLFYFGDAQANRISFASATTLTVPTQLMRTGDFSELLNTSLTGVAKPIQLYQPNSGGSAPLSCNGKANVFCSVDQTAQKLLNLFPHPNTNGGKTTNNYVTNLSDRSDTWQWDQRADWNITSKDQMYARYSYFHVQNLNSAPLGSILDGTPTNAGVSQNDLSETGMLSETHIFNPSLVNEFRFSYVWGAFANLQENYNINESAALGLGGIPFGPGYPDNGGIPNMAVSGITTFGSHGFNPAIKGQNIYQISDNITKVLGSHSLKFGIDFQNNREKLLSPPMSRGSYSFTGRYTSNLSASFTGYGVADFLADQPNSAAVGNEATENFARWYRSGYVQDDWKFNRRLTLNLGLRYDYYQHYNELAGRQGNFIATSRGIGTGSGIYQLASRSRSIPLSPAFTSLLAAENISLQYVDNPFIVSVQKTNFAPRLGFAYQLSSRTALHTGFGIFYGGMEAFGGDNIGENYPFFLSATFPAGSCVKGNCPSNGLTIEQGFSQAFSAGLQNFVASPTVNSTDPTIRTPNTISYNIMVERELSNNIVASLGYVGNISRHLPTAFNLNAADALQNPAKSAVTAEPFPKLGTDTLVTYEGTSTYNGLQARLEKRLGAGLEFLATYTFAHTLDDSADPLGAGLTYRNPNLIPIIDEYTNSAIDIRQRATLNGFYELPFGTGHAYLSRRGWINRTVGGWESSATFVAQSGFPFTVTPNISTAVGGTANAILRRDPFSPGGSPDPSNPVQCAARTRTRTNWYNPCAFGNPLPGTALGSNGVPADITNVAGAISYLGGKANQIHGPGYNRINMSLFKNIASWRDQYMQVRADIFNVLNHPTWGNPSIVTDNSNGGAITAPATFQNYTPDARFFQLSAKYVF